MKAATFKHFVCSALVVGIPFGTTLVEGFLGLRYIHSNLFKNGSKYSFYQSESTISVPSAVSDYQPYDNENPNDNASPLSINDQSYEIDPNDFFRNYRYNPNFSRAYSETTVIDADPSQVCFVFPKPKQPPTIASIFSTSSTQPENHQPASKLEPIALSDPFSYYPFAAMMQGSAPYIADHAGKTVVFHLPGELLDDTKASDTLLKDIALCWLLGMKIVIVTGCRLIQSGECKDESCRMEHAHECHNTLKVTDRATLRLIEEEAGYLRTEMERKLNRCLRANSVTSHSSGAPEANVVSGHFYTAQRFGEIRGEDFGYTGFCHETHVENVQQVLEDNDVVLLSTVGLSQMGELVNVNSYHLAATVAASMEASKLIYLSTQGCLLQNKGADQPIKELSMSIAQSITNYHNVRCHSTGFATFQKALLSLEPAAVELLLHLGWASWAVNHGVVRSHVVNPGDGSLLEELFTSKNGANTCLFHDDELLLYQEDSSNAIGADDWNEFFASDTATTSNSNRGWHPQESMRDLKFYE